MFLSPPRTVLIFLLVLLFAAPLSADEEHVPTPDTQKTVRAILAKFDKGNPGWKVRMESLVRLAKIGPTAGPILVEGLEDKSPETREFAAQALVLFADANTRPALEQALADKKPGVRVYAIQALSMLGPLPRTKENERILRSDPSDDGVRPMMAAALERADRPNQAEFRKALANYDLSNMDSARVGEVAPDFTLTDFTGKAYRLSQFRGKKTVVLRFILYDYWWRTADSLAQLRGQENEYKRRYVQPLLVLAQQTFQLKRPKKIYQDWAWPEAIPTEVLFDPLSTLSATYGVAFQTQFRVGANVWSSRPTIFVIDRDGVLRYVDGRFEQDIREEGIFPALDDLEEQRKLITALHKDDALREAARTALAPIGADTKAAIGPLAKALKDEAAEVRAGAAAALYWIAPAAGDAVPALSEALGDTDRRVRWLSGLALARIGRGARPAVSALMEALKDKDARVRAAAANALKGIGPPARSAVPALMEALKDPDFNVRAASANGLAAIGPGARAATRALIEAVKTPNEEVHLAASEALKKIDPEAAKKSGIK